MDRETKTEFGAVPLTLALLGVLFLVYAAAVGGLWAWLLAGILIVAAVAFTAVQFGHRSRAGDLDAPHPPTLHVHGDAHRVLVIADRACGVELPTLIRAHTAGAAEARVLAPVMGSRLSQLTGDESAYRDATAHLDATVAALRAAGIPAEGHLGAADPLRAADDGLGEFSPDEIIFAVHGPDAAPSDERDVVSRAKLRYQVPVCELEGLGLEESRLD